MSRWYCAGLDATFYLRKAFTDADLIQLLVLSGFLMEPITPNEYIVERVGDVLQIKTERTLLYALTKQEEPF